MSEVVDIDAKSLGSQEIERLLQSSRAALYTKSVSAPKKPSGSFQKKSLIELARTADAIHGAGPRARDATLADQHADKPRAETTSADLAADADSQDSGSGSDSGSDATSDTTPDTTQETSSEAASDMSQAALQDSEPAKPRERRARRPKAQPPRAAKVNETDAAVSEQADRAEQVGEDDGTLRDRGAETPGDPIAQVEGEMDANPQADLEEDAAEFETRSLEQLAIQAEEKSAAAVNEALNETEATEPEADAPAVKSAEYMSAYEEGRAAMQAEMVAELGEAFGTLNNLINELRSPSGNPFAELSQTIHDRVLALASDRAGQQIESLPAPFLDKISRLVNSVEEAGRSIKIKLSGQDFESIKSILEDHSELDLSIFVADETLEPGDVVIRAGAVTIQDVMRQRVAQPINEDDASFAAIGRAMRDLIGDAETDVNAAPQASAEPEVSSESETVNEIETPDEPVAATETEAEAEISDGEAE